MIAFIKNIIKKLLSNPRNQVFTIRLLELKYKFFGNNRILNEGGTNHLKNSIIGRNNKISIGKNTILKKGRIHVRGNNNNLIIEDDCSIGPDCIFYMCGDNCTIHIGKGTTFTRKIEINVQENNSTIVIGDDCMFSNRITVRTSDSHPIYDISSNYRLNFAKNIEIGNHVWIAPNTKIMKGSKIGDGAIIGSDTTINKEVPPNCLCVGRPQKIIREGVYWTRESI